MDPANPDLDQEALTHQGTRLGQHENMLQGIMETLQDLHSQFTILNALLPNSSPISVYVT